jgi:ketosteroid isomerase-like protein
MKSVTAIAAAFLLLAGMAFARQSAMASKAEMRTGPANVEQHLKDMEQQWVKASLASDGKALAPMLSEDFINIDSDGSVHNKSETVARITESKFQTSEISEVQVTPHGDSAVVTGTWIGKGVDATGKPIDAKERWADTWVMKGGKWQCVASASAPLK